MIIALLFSNDLWTINYLLVVKGEDFTQASYVLLSQMLFEVCSGIPTNIEASQFKTAFDVVIGMHYMCTRVIPNHWEGISVSTDSRARFHYFARELKFHVRGKKAHMQYIV